MAGNKTSDRVRGTVPSVEVAARVLRRSMTRAEEALWEAVRGRRLGGLRFRRQHPVGPYVLDFFCASYKLAVELDGSVHDQQNEAEYDKLRTEHLSRYGYCVLRFRNEDVLYDLPTVLQMILNVVQKAGPTRAGDQHT